MLMPILATPDPYATADEFVADGWALGFATPRASDDPMAIVELAGARVMLGTDAPEFLAPQARAYAGAGVEFHLTVPADAIDAVHAGHRAPGPLERRPWGERAFQVTIAGYRFLIAAEPQPDPEPLPAAEPRPDPEPRPAPEPRAEPAGWALSGLRLTCADVRLRPVRDTDLPTLAAIFPADVEMDPRAERYAGLDPAADRERRFLQGFWRSRGTWSPTSWALDLLVEHAGRPVGVQTLEGDDFPTLRTVDSASWLAADARGQGLGVAMRTAALALAFDGLGARAAVSSARLDNAASLGVSRHLGYVDNGVSVTDSPSGVVELRHVRLTHAAWESAGRARDVTIQGLEPALPYFGLAPSAT